MMKLAITGQDTLAAATRTCCERHFELVPLKQADLVWVCYDTPIENDVPQPEWVMTATWADVELSNHNAAVLVSSQMPVGTTARLEREFPHRFFAYSPENIRVATAVTDFESQSRIVVGRRSPAFDWLFKELLAPFTSNIILTDPETAEMCKHALNCWLGMNIAFINEIARLSARVGANVFTITEALRTDRRISSKAPLKAGGPFGGGHLARDIHVLSTIAEQHGIPAPIIRHIKESNDSTINESQT